MPTIHLFHLLVPENDPTDVTLVQYGMNHSREYNPENKGSFAQSEKRKANAKVPFTLSDCDSDSDGNAEYLAPGFLAKLCIDFKVLYGTTFTLALSEALSKSLHR